LNNYIVFYFNVLNIGAILEIVSTWLLTLQVNTEILTTAIFKGKKKERKTMRHVKRHKDTTGKEEYKQVVK
jgi:hypothetical protein